jgi:hypothetical protein
MRKGKEKEFIFALILAYVHIIHGLSSECRSFAGRNIVTFDGK